MLACPPLQLAKDYELVNLEGTQYGIGI